VVIGMAVTRAGVPVRCWTFPGDASDQLIIRRIHDDLAGWRLNRVLWVPDRGFPSGADRAYLQRGGRSCVLAERLRAPRFVVVHNPEAEERDRRVRENLCAYLEEQIAGSDSWPQRRRDELVGRLRTTPGLFPLLRRTRQGLLRLDRAAASREARLVGKWLLRTSDESLTAEDLALADKRLYQVERGWREMKGALGRALSSTTARTAFARTHNSAGSHCSSSAWSRTPPARRGDACARSSSACTS